jgi:membrane fusion protein, multidrug efflux system
MTDQNVTVKRSLRKRMAVAITLLVLVIGGVLGYHLFLKLLFSKIFAKTPEAISYVSSTKSVNTDYRPRMTAVGNLSAYNSVDVAPRVSGVVSKIYFNSGQFVKQGDRLLQMSASSDKQNLINLRAQYKYSAGFYKKMRRVLSSGGVSKDQLALQKSKVDSLRAQVNQAELSVEYKSVLAPFSGKMGMRKVNLGQYLSPGTTIAKLVALDPILFDFSLPEQDVAKIKLSQRVSITMDDYPGKLFAGKITAIDSEVDSSTHTVDIRASVDNKSSLLYPGGYASVLILSPNTRKVVTVPATAVVPSLYGDVVYTVEKGGVSKRDKKPYQIAIQNFVKVGQSDGDRLIIVSGLKAGVDVVDAGQLKLQNKSKIRINNTINSK